jgi:heterodisulfide reductase subunit A
MSKKVGVFVCHCGTNIGGVVDVPEVVEYAGALDDVILAEEGRWICSVDYLNKIKDFIKEKGLEKVVVACCTPRTHEPTFRSTLKEADLNPYLLEFVSIREQSSWVHKDNPVLATEKAKDLVKMGVAKARLLEPAEEIRVPVGKDALVIGGGIAGINAALALADNGYQVHLVEKTDRLGGILNRLEGIAPSDASVDEVLRDKLDKVEGNENIKVHTDIEIGDVEGYVGNYKVKLSGDSGEELGISTIVVATGMNEVLPEAQFGFREYDNVVTQMEFEEMLREGNLEGINSVAFITCVNSKNEERGCCSIGCMSSVKNAKRVLEVNPDSKVWVLHRDLNFEGTNSRYLKEAKKSTDIKFIRYPDEKAPEVSKGDGGLKLKVQDMLLGRELELEPDMVVLVTALKGDDSVDKLKGMLKVSANADDFFIEAHEKLRPLDFASDGIYVCGAARSPKGVKESTEEALGAAMRAAIPMNRGYVEAEGIVADIDAETCVPCKICSKTCPYGAIKLIDVKQPPEVIKALCKGCGSCAAECPRDAITIIHYTDEQILAQVEAALEENPGEKIVAFCCHWCALGAVDLAGVSRYDYPPNVRIIRVMCSGRVDQAFIEKAFELGAAGVMVAGCEFPTCHYINGNEKCRDRMERVKKALTKEGVDTGKLWTVWLSAADGPKFVSTVKSMVKELGIGGEGSGS